MRSKKEKATGKIDDEANVNKRRSEIGLFPIEQYMGMINQFYKKSRDKK